MLTRTTFVAITGSAGKTTTKDLAARVLAASGQCHFRMDSDNLPRPVAATVLKAKRSHRYAVLEVSGHGPGIMDWPLRIVRPHIAVLTVIGRDHYRAFNSIDEIAAEKGRLIKALPADGVAVLNYDDARIRAIGEQCACRIIWVGTGEGADIRLKKASSNWPSPLTLEFDYEGRTFDVQTQLHGTHLALSVLCALAVGVASGIPLERAIAALRDAAPAEGRMQVVASDGVTFIRDDWKAPDWSLMAPLEFLRNASARRKVAVIGSVSDFSDKDGPKYKRLARKILAYAELVVFVGPNAHRALRAQDDSNRDSLKGFPDIRDASVYLRKELRDGDLVLLKGSNKADHLVRVILDRQRRIACWEPRCGLQRFCGGCPRLYEPRHSNREGFDEKPKWGDSNHEGVLGGALPAGVIFIVGLRNPDARFDLTPHNLGGDVLDAWVQRVGSEWESTEDGVLAELTLADRHRLLLFKPGVAMNLSGPVVRRLLEAHNGRPDQCIIVHDDMDLPFGTVRRKLDGGHGGHNGIGSIIEALGTHQFRRVRVGCGHTGGAATLREKVVERFSPSEEARLDGVVNEAIVEIEAFLGFAGPK